jgi:hypothetical protein
MCRYPKAKDDATSSSRAPREPEEQVLAMPGCTHPGPATGAGAAPAIVSLGQVLDLLAEDPHQRANLLAENGTDDAKPVGDEVGSDGQPQELITGPDA